MRILCERKLTHSLMSLSNIAIKSPLNKFRFRLSDVRDRALSVELIRRHRHRHAFSIMSRNTREIRTDGVRAALLGGVRARVII